MRDYTKTGKKVKCINSKRIDLTYKKVYDIFIDVDGEEFVIDESGDWHDRNPQPFFHFCRGDPFGGSQWH